MIPCRQTGYSSCSFAQFRFGVIPFVNSLNSRESEAQTNAQIAVSMLSAFPGTNTTVTNLASLLERLRETDSRAKQLPKYE